MQVTRTKNTQVNSNNKKAQVKRTKHTGKQDKQCTGNRTNNAQVNRTKKTQVNRTCR